MNSMELHDWSEICSFFSIIQFKTNPCRGTHIFVLYTYTKHNDYLPFSSLNGSLLHTTNLFILEICVGFFCPVNGSCSTQFCRSFLLLRIDSVLLTSTNCNCGNCMSSSVSNFVYHFTITLGKNVDVVRIYWREIM